MQGLNRFGATPDEWFLFSTMLGLSEDLLPAVANPNAQIAPDSQLKSLGKTPSHYGKNRKVYGVGDWTNKRATAEEIEKWGSVPDYSICLIARTKKGIDCDITDTSLSARINTFIKDFLFDNFGVTLPMRYREGSPKFLLAFTCHEETLKRVIRTEHGIIEFLGNRQQFLVAGTHSSGDRYEWVGLENGIPDLTIAQFDKLWAALQENFGIEPEIRERERKTLEGDADEPILKRLYEKEMVISRGAEGSYNIVCPFAHEHSTESTESATRYWPAHTGGYAHASIKCLHAHCAHRSTEQFKVGLGFELSEGFDEITDDLTSGFDFDFASPLNIGKFELIPALIFAHDGANPNWLVKRMIPASAIGYIYGPSSSGKTFITFDIVAAIARGIPWRGRKTKQGWVIYICAEGAYFFRNRIKAYAKHNGLENPEDLPIQVIDAQPDIMNKQDILALIAAIESIGEPIACVVLDTYAACMVGDENSSADVGKVLSNLKLMQSALDTVVILVHHAGKDTQRGARGWSGLRAAVDFEFQVVREGDVHALVNTKQKDGEDGMEFGFTLTSVNLGEDEDGEPIESCVVASSDRKPLASVTARTGVNMNAKETLIYHTVQDYYAEEGGYPSAEEIVTRACADGIHKPAEMQKALASICDKGALHLQLDGSSYWLISDV